MSHPLTRPVAGRAIALTATAVTVFLSAPAGAGQCPADKVQPGVRTTGETKARDVADTVIGAVDLAKEKVNLSGRMLRLRRLVVQPGGVVPWHSHGERPAIIYVVSGSIHEYSSNCAIAIEHKAGEVSVETLGVQHWWRNTTRMPTVLLSTDLFHDAPQEDRHVM